EGHRGVQEEVQGPADPDDEDRAAPEERGEPSEGYGPSRARFVSVHGSAAPAAAEAADRRQAAARSAAPRRAAEEAGGPAEAAEDSRAVHPGWDEDVDRDRRG